MTTLEPAGRLVKLESRSGLYLDGILYSGRGNDTLLLHVHGAFGNFYHNPFLQVFARACLDQAIDFLPFNLAAHDGVAEGDRRDGEFEYVGGSVVPFDTCIDDIDGAVDFARSHYRQVILQGHSMGCDRVISYVLAHTDRCVAAVILLSPCDSYQLHANWLGSEAPEAQAERLRLQGLSSDCGLSLLPEREYGIAQDEEWTYPIPVTSRALLSISEGPPFRLFRLSRPVDYRVDLPCFAYIGGKDPLQAADPSDMFRHLERRCRSLERMLVAEGGHGLEECEEIVAAAVTRWVREAVAA